MAQWLRHSTYIGRLCILMALALVAVGKTETKIFYFILFFNWRLRLKYIRSNKLFYRSKVSICLCSVPHSKGRVEKRQTFCPWIRVKFILEVTNSDSVEVVHLLFSFFIFWGCSPTCALVIEIYSSTILWALCKETISSFNIKGCAP